MSALKIKQALSSLSNPGRKNIPTSSFTSSTTINTPITITNKRGIEKLNSINDDFALLENSFENLQKVYDRFQTLLGDVENTFHSVNDLTDDPDEQETKKNIYKYASIPFEPYLYKETRLVFNSKFDDLNICPNVRNELTKSNDILQEHIVNTEKFLTEFKSVLCKLSDSFSYTLLNNFSQSTINSDLEEKYGIVLFYIANLAKSGKLTHKEY